MTSIEAKPRKIVPTTPPISILSTDAARTFTHIHPVLLLAFYYFRFPSLVANPIPVLLGDILPISLIQIAYVTTCLPPLKSSDLPQPVSRSLKSGQRKRSTAPAKSNESISNKIIVCSLNEKFNIQAGNPPILMIFPACFTRTHFNDVSQYSSLDHHFGPLRCSPDNPSCADYSLRRSSVTPCRVSAFLHLWRLRRYLERNSRGNASV